MERSRRHSSARADDQQGIVAQGRRYSDVPLVCDKCGRTADRSIAGGRDGHSQLCPGCAAERDERRSKSANALWFHVLDEVADNGGAFGPKIASFVSAMRRAEAEGADLGLLPSRLVQAAYIAPASSTHIMPRAIAEAEAVFKVIPKTAVDSPKMVCAKCGWPVVKDWAGYGHAAGYRGARHRVVVVPADPSEMVVVEQTTEGADGLTDFGRQLRDRAERQRDASKQAARADLPLLDPDEVEAEGWHVASSDYPELEDILWKRPDHIEAKPVNIRQVSLAKMASSGGDRTGNPEVDAVIDAFLDEPCGDWTTSNTRIRDLTPAEAAGACQEVSEQFVQFAKAHGLERVYATQTDMDEMGYKTRGKANGDVLDDNGNIVPGFYFEHTVNEIYVSGQHFPYTVDFTAKQYGYNTPVKVTASKTATTIDDLMKNPSNTWRFKHITGPRLKRINEALPSGYKVNDIEQVLGDDNWCRFRENSNCYFPKDLDVQATEVAGYDVWFPVLRGHCGRQLDSEQRACPIAEPGPKSGDPNWKPKLTKSWAQGGQRVAVRKRTQEVYSDHESDRYDDGDRRGVVSRDVGAAQRQVGRAGVLGDVARRVVGAVTRRVEFTQAAAKAVRKVSRSGQRDFLVVAIDALGEDALTGDLKKIGPNEWRRRIGAFRVVFEIRGDVVYVTAVGPRGDVYKSGAIEGVPPANIQQAHIERTEGGDIIVLLPDGEISFANDPKSAFDMVSRWAKKHATGFDITMLTWHGFDVSEIPEGGSIIKRAANQTYCSNCGEMVRYNRDAAGLWDCAQCGSAIECSECGQPMSARHEHGKFGDGAFVESQDEFRQRMRDKWLPKKSSTDAHDPRESWTGTQWRRAGFSDVGSPASNHTAVKIPVAALQPGMVVQVTDFLPEGAFSLKPGLTAWVPTGSIRPNSPTATVVSVDRPKRTYKGLYEILVTFDNGHTVAMSSRQRVELISDGRTAAWVDVRDKGVRIRRDGGVRILSNTGFSVTAEVRGDHGVYISSITRVPGTKQRGLWACGCLWQRYAWARSRAFKYLQGRPCSHSMALLYEIQSHELRGGEMTKNAPTPFGEKVWEQPEEPSWGKGPGTAQEHWSEGLEFESSIDDGSTKLAIGNIVDSLRIAGKSDEASALTQSLQVVASTSPEFKAKVRGRVVDVKVVDAVPVVGNQPVNATDVIYPTWDPELGLVSEGSKTAAELQVYDPTSESDGGSSIGTFPDEYADRISALTKDMTVDIVAGNARIHDIDAMMGRNQIIYDGHDDMSDFMADMNDGDGGASGTYPLRVRLGSLIKEAGQDGCMCALSPSRDVCERLSKLAEDAGFTAEDPAQIHLTLAYCGKTAEIDRDAFLGAVRAFAAQQRPFQGAINGLGVFFNGDENALWAAADIQGLAAARTALTEFLLVAGTPAKTDHDFVPHLTLAYADEPIVMLPDFSKITGTELKFTTIVAAYGGEWTHFDLVGSSGEIVAVEKVGSANDQSIGDGDDSVDGSGRDAGVNGRSVSHLEQNPVGTATVSGMRGGPQHQGVRADLRGDGRTDPGGVSHPSQVRAEEVHQPATPGVSVTGGSLGGTRRSATTGDVLGASDSVLAQEQAGLGCMPTVQQRRPTEVSSQTSRIASEEDWFDQTRREHPDWPVIDGVIVTPDHHGEWHESEGVWIFQDNGGFPCLRMVGQLPGETDYTWQVIVPVGFGPHSGKTLSGKAKTLDAAKVKAMAATNTDDVANDKYEERQLQIMRKEYGPDYGTPNYVASRIAEINAKAAVAIVEIRREAAAPPDLRLGEAGHRCGICKSYRENGDRPHGACSKFDISVFDNEVCDAWVDRRGWVRGGDEVSGWVVAVRDSDHCKFCGSDNLSGGWFGADGYADPYADLEGNFNPTTTWDIVCQECGKFQNRRNTRRNAKADTIDQRTIDTASNEMSVWEQRVEEEFQRHEGPMSGAEHSFLHTTIPNPDAAFDPVSYYDMLTDEHRKKASESYQTGHQPLGDGPPLYDLTYADPAIPESWGFGMDVYEHPEWYVFGTSSYTYESIRVVKEMRGKPDAMVKIYRGVIRGSQTINTGDWVAISESYARKHIESNLSNEDGVVISATVPARTVRNGGSDLIEWGYWGPSISARVGSKTAQIDEDEGRRAVEEECAKGKFNFAGLIIKALDTGRVLMTQRTPYHRDDPETVGKFEYPGGEIDEGETAIDAALREFTEETGLELPQGWNISGCQPAGNYLAIHVVVPHESWTTDAALLTRETMGIGWFEQEQIEGTTLARPEVQETDWELVAEASLVEAEAEAILHSEPEPALPAAYGAEEESMPGPNDPFVPGDPRLAHLAPKDGEAGAANDDIASAAAEFLSKQALKTFSPAEQKQLIDEGADEHLGASNTDRLSLENTFYEMQQEDDELVFW